jgi:uncharacterized protein (TIGR02266 family)
LTTSGQVWKGQTRNLSEGGVYVNTFVPPQVDTVLHIELHLADEYGILRLNGGVCWTRGVMGSVEGEPPGCGIRFLSPSEPAHAVLRAIVASRRAFEDRRAHPRAPLRVDVALSSSGETYLGIAKDIGEGGVYVAMSAPLACGSIVNVEFSLPNLTTRVVVQGEVRWVRPPTEGGLTGCGIRWLSLPSHVARAIGEYVEARKSLSSER